MLGWEQYRIGSNIPHDIKVIKFIECLSEELQTAATQTFCLYFDAVVQLSKSTGIIPVSICVICSKALSSRQKLGKTFCQFSLKVCGSVTD